MGVRKLLRLSCLIGVLSHFAEIGVRFKLFSNGRKRIEPQEKIVIQFDIDWAARNAQILEFAADKNDMRLVMFRGMLRRNPRHDSVRRHHIQHVQTFNRRGNECCVR